MPAAASEDGKAEEAEKSEEGEMADGVGEEVEKEIEVGLLIILKKSPWRARWNSG